MGSITALRERAKELQCLYRVNEIVHRDKPPHVVFREVVDVLAAGWQRPETTAGRIVYLGRSYVSEGFTPKGHCLSAPIHIFDHVVGTVEVVDVAELAPDEDAFLPEERTLLDAIAARLGELLEWKQQELTGEVLGAKTSHWKWREEFATHLAASLDPERFGVRALYLGGSTESAEAGPESDIDLVIVFGGTQEQRRELSLWLEGWSLCLGELGFRHTGSATRGGLLDLSWRDRPPSAHEIVRLRELALASREGR